MPRGKRPSELDLIVSQVSDRILDEEADRQKVPRDYARKIKRIESGGRPDVINGQRRSSAGAIGPMQLMPGTARELGVDPYDIEQNLEGGVRYAGQQLKAFGGNQQLGAAAYNSGPGNVRKAGNRVPNIPETQKYAAQFASTSGDQSELDKLVNQLGGTEERATKPQPVRAPRTTVRGPVVPAQRIPSPLSRSPFSGQVVTPQVQQAISAIRPEIAAEADRTARERDRFEKRSTLGQAAEIATTGFLRGAEGLLNVPRVVGGYLAAGKPSDPVFTPAAQEQLQRQERAQDVTYPNAAPIGRGVASGLTQTPAIMAAGVGAPLVAGGIQAANEDWSQPGRALTRTAISTVAPIAGARAVQAAIRPATMTGRLASGTVGGAVGNVIPAGAEQLISEGRLNPQQLAQQAVIGGVTGAVTPPRAEARRVGRGAPPEVETQRPPIQFRYDEDGRPVPLESVRSDDQGQLIDPPIVPLPPVTPEMRGQGVQQAGNLGRQVQRAGDVRPTPGSMRRPIQERLAARDDRGAFRVTQDLPPDRQTLPIDRTAPLTDPLEIADAATTRGLAPVPDAQATQVIGQRGAQPGKPQPSARDAFRAEADAAKQDMAAFLDQGDLEKAYAEADAAHRALVRLRRGLPRAKTAEEAAQISQIDREISFADRQRKNIGARLAPVAREKAKAARGAAKAEQQPTAEIQPPRPSTGRRLAEIERQTPSERLAEYPGGELPRTAGIRLEGQPAEVPRPPLAPRGDRPRVLPLRPELPTEEPAAQPKTVTSEEKQATPQPAGPRRKTVAEQAGDMEGQMPTEDLDAWNRLLNRYASENPREISTRPGEPGSGSSGNRSYSPYNDLVRNHKPQINRLHEINMESEEGRQLMGEIRSYAERRGVKNSYVEDLFDDIRNAQSDRAKMENRGIAPDDASLRPPTGDLQDFYSRADRVPPSTEPLVADEAALNQEMEANAKDLFRLQDRQRRGERVEEQIVAVRQRNAEIVKEIESLQEGLEVAPRSERKPSAPLDLPAEEPPIRSDAEARLDRAAENVHDRAQIQTWVAKYKNAESTPVQRKNIEKRLQKLTGIKDVEELRRTLQNYEAPMTDMEKFAANMSPEDLEARIKQEESDFADAVRTGRKEDSAAMERRIALRKRRERLASEKKLPPLNTKQSARTERPEAKEAAPSIVRNPLDQDVTQISDEVLPKRIRNAEDILTRIPEDSSRRPRVEDFLRRAKEEQGKRGRKGASMAPRPEAPEFTQKVLGKAAKGTPGLSSEPLDVTIGAIPIKGHEIVYRDSSGYPVARAELVEVDGRLKVKDFATDKGKGLLSGRAAIAVGKEIARLGATEPAGTISPDAARLLEKYRRQTKRAPSIGLQSDTEVRPGDRVIASNPENKSGVSAVKDRSAAPRAAKSLAQFVKEEGGIKPSTANRGELSYASTKESKRVGIINRAGTPADEMRRRAIEAGYGEWATEGEFLNSLRDDVEGRKSFSAEREIDYEAEYRKSLKPEEQGELDAFNRFLDDSEAARVYDRISSGEFTNDDVRQLTIHAEKHGLPDDAVDAIVSDGTEARSRRGQEAAQAEPVPHSPEAQGQETSQEVAPPSSSEQALSFSKESTAPNGAKSFTAKQGDRELTIRQVSKGGSWDVIDESGKVLGTRQAKAQAKRLAALEIKRRGEEEITPLSTRKASSIQEEIDELQRRADALPETPEGNAEYQKIQGQIFGLEKRIEQAAFEDSSGQPALRALAATSERFEGGALVSLTDARKASDLSKAEFDKAILDLADADVITLHRHDWPASLSESEKAGMVVDEFGNHYIGAALSEPGRISDIEDRLTPLSTGRSEGSKYFGTPAVKGRPESIEEAHALVGNVRSEFRQRTSDPGTLYTNRQGALALRSAANQTGITMAATGEFEGGVFRIEDAAKVADHLENRADAYGKNGDRLRDIADSLREAVADAKANGSNRIVIASADAGGLTNRKQLLREERFHQFQGDQELLRIENADKIERALNRNPVYQQIKRRLLNADAIAEVNRNLRKAIHGKQASREKYAAAIRAAREAIKTAEAEAYMDDPAVLISEASAKIASGQWKEFGLKSETEGIDFLERYYEVSARVVGLRAVSRAAPGTPAARRAQENARQRLRVERSVEPGRGMGRDGGGREGAPTPLSVAGRNAGGGQTRGPQAPGGGVSQTQSLRGISAASLRSQPAPSSGATPPVKPRSTQGPQRGSLGAITAQSLRTPGGTPPGQPPTRGGGPSSSSPAPTPKKGRFAIGFEIFGDLYHGPKSLLSSFDISAAGRQGFFLSAPPSQFPIAARAFGRQVKSLVSTKSYDQFIDTIRSSPDYQTAQESGLFLATDDPGSSFSARDESFVSRLIGKLPHVKYSEQAYKTYLDSLRLDTFAKYRRAIDNQPGTVEQKQAGLKAAAEWINTSTGRGKIHGKSGEMVEAATPLLNAVFFAPRYTISRFQMLNPLTYARNLKAENRVVFRQQMGELFQSAAVLTVTGALAKAAGADVGIDPEDSDFLKLKFGNTRYDILAGLQQTARLGIRIGDWIKQEFTEEDQKKLAGTRGGTAEAVKRFARNKLAPVPGFFVDWLNDWKNAIGEKHTPTEWSVKNPVVSRVLPILWADMVEAYLRGYRNGGVEEGAKTAARFAPAVGGIGVQDYERRPGTVGLDSDSKTGRELRRFGKSFERVAPKEGEPERLHRARARRIETWFDQYGEQLINSSEYRNAKPDDQERALDHLRRSIGAQANQQSPRMDGFEPSRIFRSLRQGERMRERRRRGLIYAPEDE